MHTLGKLPFPANVLAVHHCTNVRHVAGNLEPCSQHCYTLLFALSCMSMDPQDMRPFQEAADIAMGAPDLFDRA